jgi:hypothetical protein
MSELDFNEVKDEMLQITSLFPELKKDGYKNFWLKAFSEE